MSDTMGERIYKRRTELNMTMQELGDKVGVQASAVNKWEKGLVENIKASTIKKLASALETSPAYLMIGGNVDQGNNARSAAIADLMVDVDSQELLVEINSMDKNEKKELLDYALFLKKRREG